MPTSADYRDWAGRSYGWRYLAQRIDGSGTPGIWLDNELPLSDVTITDVLSGPPQMTATIDPVFARELGLDKTPILGEWATAIYAESDGQIRAGCLLAGSGFQGPKWSLDCTGFTTVPKDMQYPESIQFTEVDPVDIARHIWSKIQAQQGSNMGMAIDAVTRTPIRVGKPVPPPTTGTADTSGSSTADVSTADEKPYELNWWSTHDLGGEIDKLAASTPFEYHERHAWSFDRTTVNHFLDFGYPSIGARRANLRFVLGENVQTIPNPDRDGTDFSNHVVVLGAGEGSEMVRGEARVNDGRVRRMVILDDKSLTDQNSAVSAARLELARRQQLLQINELVVRNTPMAPLGSFGVGDEIRIQASTDWIANIDLWCRVTSMTINPQKPDLMALTVMRSDWVV